MSDDEYMRAPHGYFPIEVDDVLIAFPAQVKHLMPVDHEIPEGVEHGTWGRLMRRWFSFGLSGVRMLPKEGIDPNLALRHLKAIMGSFEPKHEHKERAVAFLLSEWFEWVEVEVDGVMQVFGDTKLHHEMVKEDA